MAVVVVMMCCAHGWLLMGVVDGGSLKDGGAIGKFFALARGWAVWIEVQTISMADAQEAA